MPRRNILISKPPRHLKLDRRQKTTRPRQRDRPYPGACAQRLPHSPRHIGRPSIPDTVPSCPSATGPSSRHSPYVSHSITHLSITLQNLCNTQTPLPPKLPTILHPKNQKLTTPSPTQTTNATTSSSVPPQTPPLPPKTPPN